MMVANPSDVLSFLRARDGFAKKDIGATLTCAVPAGTHGSLQGVPLRTQGQTEWNQSLLVLYTHV